MADVQDMTAEQLTEAVQWANLSRKLLGDKKTKIQFEKLVKQVSPEIETSEDLAEPHLSPLRAEIAAVQGQLKTITDGAAEWNRNEQFNSLRRAKYTDEAIEKIKTIMETKGIRDPMDAAAVFDKSIPVARARIDGVSPQNYGNDIFGLQENTAETLDKLFNNTDAFIAEQVNAVADEYRNQE